MASELFFLQLSEPTKKYEPNFAKAKGITLFKNYSQSPLDILTNAQTEALVKSGVAAAIADAQALFRYDPDFSYLFTESIVVGLDEGSAKSATKVIASFEVNANQTFSFDFSAALGLETKEIERPNAEYNQARANTAFLVLDISNINKPRILDYFSIYGKLVSSDKKDLLKFGRSKNVILDKSHKIANININGNDGVDFITGAAKGTYQRKFKQATNIAVVEINVNAVKFLSDTLIDNLGDDVIYGSLGNDRLNGSNANDKMYGSLGDDKLHGKKGDDILEGGQGDDWLEGDQGNDRLHGGFGNDTLIGGKGSDFMVGGDGHDQFIFNRSDRSFKGELDIIQDFEVGIDKIVFQNWDKINTDQWLDRIFSQGSISDTQKGVLFSFDLERYQGQLLLTGVKMNELSNSDFVFG